jgi:glycyl-tRNA synthetase beta chain
MERELLLELGCEELPASWLPDLTNQIGEVLVAQLTGHRLPPEAPAETFSTPRRLTVRVARIPERQTDLEELVNGPPVSAGFKPDAVISSPKLRAAQTAEIVARHLGIQISFDDRLAGAFE